MTWRTIDQRFDTGEMSNTNNFIPFTPNKNIIMSGVIVWMMFENNPTYTDVTAALYGDQGGSPSLLIASSTTTKTKAEIQTLDNALKGIGFAFTNVNLQSGTTYHFVINGTGYTPAASSAIYLAKKYDPTYSNTTLTTNPTSMGKIPGEFVIVGSEL